MMTVLERLRRDKGLTQAALAEAANVGRTMICHYEQRKRTPTIGTIAKLAKALGVKPKVLAADFAPDSERAS